MRTRSRTVDEAVAHARKMRASLRGQFLRLWCPVCFRSLISKREAYDYPESILLVLRCPECVGGDYDDPSYFDEDGAEVDYDVTEIEKRRAAR